MVIFHTVVWQGIAEEMTFSKGLERIRKRAMQISGERAFRREAAVKTKALKQETLWVDGGRARRPHTGVE